jgi:two-component sensor histidine kinase
VDATAATPPAGEPAAADPPAPQGEQIYRALARAEAVTQLAAGIAHDAGNALQVVSLEARYLASTLTDPKQLEAVQAILAAGDNAAALTRDLLTLSRQKRTPPAALALSPLLAGLERMVRPLLKATIDLELSGEEGLSVIAEEQQLLAALVNLVVNARDAMPAGGTLRLRVTAPPPERLPPGLAPGGHVCLLIEDTGMGMPPEILARATEAFFTTKGSRGTGLGLAMVESFAVRSRGRLRIESRPGKGTRVELLLPRAPVEPVARALPLSLQRIRTRWMAELLRRWAEAGSTGGLPTLAAVEPALSGHDGATLLVSVDEARAPAALRLLHFGERLRELLAAAGGQELREELGALEAAYRAVLASRTPSYEHVRYSLGDGPPVRFERLILPFALGGERVTHLLGAVLFEGLQEAAGGER